MKNIFKFRKSLGLLAVAGALSILTPTQGAQALSLSNPGGAFSAKYASEGMTTDVRWRRHRGWHRHHGRRHHRRHFRFFR